MTEATDPNDVSDGPPRESAGRTHFTEAGSGPGIPIGGLFGPLYIEAYAEAWRQLIPLAAPRLALPILYLQRHTFELLVKDLLLRALNIRDDLHTLEDLFGDPPRVGACDTAHFKTAHSQHRFAELFPALEVNLSAIENRELPTLFTQIRNLFFGVDGDKPDKLRYDSQPVGKDKVVTKPSFPGLGIGSERKYAPCEQLAQMLSELLLVRAQAFAAMVDDEAEPPGGPLGAFFMDLFERQRSTDCAVRSRLDTVAKATAERSLVWSPAPTTFQLKHHQQLRNWDVSLTNTCLQSSSFNGRTFVLLGLVDINPPPTPRYSSAFLAAVTDAGELTRGFCPDDGQSDLTYEIEQARAHLLER